MSLPSGVILKTQKWRELLHTIDFMLNLFKNTYPQVSPCLRCGSSRVLVGLGRASFRPYRFKEFAFSVLTNTIGIENSRMKVCLDCGLITGNVDVEKANKIFQTYAKNDLKERIPDKPK